MAEDLEDVARAWWESRRLAAGTRHERKQWSLGEPSEVASGLRAVDEIVDGGGERAIELVVALLNTAPAGSGVPEVGAGPLEDLVVGHGNALAPRLDDLARRSAVFRGALASVWIEPGVLDAQAAARLSRWIPGLAAEA